MKNFALYQPATLAEAVELLGQKESCQVLAGGTDLMVRWKRGIGEPEAVMNIKQIQELNFVQETEAGLEIGALVKVAELQENQVVRELYPALGQAMELHSSPLIRNLATVVGNICNASPAADLTPALLVYGAKVKLRGQAGERIVELREFMVGPGKTVREKGELVVSIIIPTPDADLKSCFLKEGKRKAHEIAVVNGAVSYRSQNGQISNLKVALGAVAPKTLLVEDLAWFTEINDDSLERLAQVIQETVTPITDQRSTDWYRKEVIQVLVKRALVLAQSV